MILPLVPQRGHRCTRLVVCVSIDMDEQTRLLVCLRKKSRFLSRLPPVGTPVSGVVQVVIRRGQVFAIHERTLFRLRWYIRRGSSDIRNDWGGVQVRSSYS